MSMVDRDNERNNRDEDRRSGDNEIEPRKPSVVRMRVRFVFDHGIGQTGPAEILISSSPPGQRTTSPRCPCPDPVRVAAIESGYEIGEVLDLGGKQGQHVENGFRSLRGFECNGELHQLTFQFDNQTGEGIYVINIYVINKCEL